MVANSTGCLQGATGGICQAARLARFEQEARATAALNHPHIAVVHDIGTEGSIHFMVQEYLEGESLRERLDKGALPLDKALDLAIEVGEVLVAAHKAGIIHRDLKPDNSFVTEEGHAKVLDFGLPSAALATAPCGGCERHFRVTFRRSSLRIRLLEHAMIRII